MIAVDRQLSPIGFDYIIIEHAVIVNDRFALYKKREASNEPPGDDASFQTDRKVPAGGADPTGEACHL